MSGFFQEVQRRKVYRVAVAYVVAAGGIIQLASAAFPAWELPNWSLRLVIVLLLTGFPIALILAWAFDVTPEGIITTPTTSSPGHRRRNLFILLAAGAIISAIAGFFVMPRAVAHRVEKSIAVLPFQNLSDEKENAYFADGIQDDILTNLSRIGDLKVISRTSVMQYRGQATNVREIAKALGVSTVLEGSVRRVGNRIRMNVQLIDATNDEHIWANDYDRDVTDVFTLQSDLAREIAAALQAKLSPSEKSQIERKPTENNDAYLAFLQAQTLFGQGIEEFGKLKQSEQLFERAIQLDPNFALAYARYSQLESWLLHSHEGTGGRKEKARSLAEQALRLQPDLPEAHLALGFSHYYGDSDYAAALKEFQIARRGLPNESEAYLAIGAIERRQGKWADSTANLEKAVSLNPKDTWPLQNLAFNYAMARNFDAANRTVDRALALNPTGYGLWDIKSKLAISEKGDLSVAEKALAAAQSAPLNAEQKLMLVKARVDILLLQRKYREVLKEAQNAPDDLLRTLPGALGGKYFLMGIAKQALHDNAGARDAFLQARKIIEDQLKTTPDDAGAHMLLAQTLACLNDKEAALAESKKATELLPESKDAFEGPEITQGAAQVHALIGDNARAIEILDGLLSRPSSVTVETLKINPAWDSLRSDPRFEALLNKYSGKT